MRAHGRGMLKLLLLGTVVPALPVTGCALSVAALAEGWRTGNGLEVVGNVVVIVILLPLAAWGGFWIARAWTQAARAAQPADYLAVTGVTRSDAPGRDGLPVRRVWLGYLAGVAVLLAAAAAVPYVISDNAAPIDLGNIPVAGFVLAYAGPLGFLSPISLVALRAVADRSHPAGRCPLAAAGKTAAAVLAVGYSLLVGFPLYELTNVLAGDGFVALIAVLANLLTFALPILLISVGANPANRQSA